MNLLEYFLWGAVEELIQRGLPDWQLNGWKAYHVATKLSRKHWLQYTRGWGLA